MERWTTGYCCIFFYWQLNDKFRGIIPCTGCFISQKWMLLEFYPLNEPHHTKKHCMSSFYLRVQTLKTKWSGDLFEKLARLYLHSVRWGRQSAVTEWTKCLIAHTKIKRRLFLVHSLRHMLSQTPTKCRVWHNSKWFCIAFGRCYRNLCILCFKGFSVF